MDLLLNNSIFFSNVGELQTAHSNARMDVCDYNILHNYFLNMFENSENPQQQ